MKNYTSYFEIRRDLESGALSCARLVSHYLQNIEGQNGHINAFLEVFAESAQRQAVEIDRKLSNGTAGRLAGLVVGIKDLFCYKDHQVTCGSHILEGFESQITATSLQRLIDEDAIVIGRQNCDEFAMGSSNENSAFGSVRNPVNPQTVPGGSSGGSAAAVAADMCQASIGSDTGGSIRQPAAFCGIYGIKPTYSRVSRYGLTAYSSSFDCVGVLAKSLEDTALVMEIMAGHDPLDSTSSKKEVPSFTQFLEPSTDKYEIAVIKELNEAEGYEEDVKLAFADFVEKLKSQGHRVREVSFPYLDFLLPTYYILTSAEASANLSRFDGARYGYRTENPENLEAMYKRSRTEGFGKEVLRRIMLGTFVLSASYHDAFYTKAQKARKLIRDFTEGILENHDFIIMPTTPSVAFGLGTKSKDPIQMYLSDLFTVQASVSGIPAISLPFEQNRDGMPVGVQVMTKAFQEGKLLSFSKEIEEL